MNRNKLKKLLSVLQAFEEGKVIQYKDQGVWRDVATDEGLFVEKDFANYNDYRIKTWPMYRPFKDADECWNEMLKHQPFGWVKTINFGVYCVLVNVNCRGALIGKDPEIMPYPGAFNEYTFADGTLFGIKEE